MMEKGLFDSRKVLPQNCCSLIGSAKWGELSFINVEFDSEEEKMRFYKCVSLIFHSVRWFAWNDIIFMDKVVWGRRGKDILYGGIVRKDMGNKVVCQYIDVDEDDHQSCKIDSVKNANIQSIPHESWLLWGDFAVMISPIIVFTTTLLVSQVIFHHVEIVIIINITNQSHIFIHHPSLLLSCIYTFIVMHNHITR